MRRSAVEKDKRRSNILQSVGWNVMHFTTSALKNDLPGTLSLVQESVARYGGLWHPEERPNN
ncbi:MAG: DUF559 domain-containing protein [Flavobacteriales bacterium]|nr:DUF559 domain-containing protein [Flavobacteriales bacterium]